jgi:hypothetical protein
MKQAKPLASFLFASLSLSLAPLTMLAACGGDASSTCDPRTQTGCDDGLVCEDVENGGTPACYAPVEVQGRVFDLADDSAVAGARVVLLDPNHAPLGQVAISADDGSYALRVPTTRHADGTPIAVQVTLRADAATFQSFPAGLREALPIDTAAAAPQDGRLVVASALTDVGLIALPAGAGDASIAGHVEVPADGGGVLVVAERGGHGASAIADAHGDFVLYNLAAGDYQVAAYAHGSSWAPATVTLAAASEARVDLALDAGTLGVVAGTVQMVDGGGAAATSVLLVVESTYDDSLGRGATPPGLRVGQVSGSYQLDGVPAGHYVVLAAFENDGLVRDPDTSIGGTATVHIEVTDGQTTTVDGFKITGALAIVGPGADAPEAVTGAPTLRWQDDSSEDEYQVVVLDALGNTVWEQSVAGVSGGQPELVYAGPALDAGMYYQFRVTSLKMGVALSRSEDLRGVFFVP